MPDVRVLIHAKDRKVSAMVKALAFEVDGPRSVAGASKDFLQSHGHLILHFSTNEKAHDFRDSVATYLPGFLARVAYE